MGSPEHIETVAASCAACHFQLDNRMGHEEMKEKVMEAIIRRTC